MLMKRKIPYGRQYIDNEDINEVISILKSDFITQGPKTGEFEEKLADYCGSKYAVTFNSGTSALHAAYSALGVGDGDEIITTPNTFIATSNAALYLNAIPVFVDLEEDTGNIDLSLIEEKITENTKVIVPVHYGGNPVNLEKLRKIAKKHNIAVIEDASHAIGARYKENRIGNCKYSEMAIFSFHPVKHITTGEGGAVLTNNEDFYEKLLLFRTHGVTKKNFTNTSDGDWYYEMQSIGYNYRMTDIQATLGISQLKKLDEFVRRRLEIARVYDAAFGNNSYFEIPKETNHCSSSYHLYPIRLKEEYKANKKEIFTKMRNEGLLVQVHYIPVYLQPYYQNLGYNGGLCPLAEDFYQREISIPIHPSMSSEDVDYVIKTIYKVFDSMGDD